MHACPSSPNGMHCYHVTHAGPWFGVNPPPTICCHCGQDQRAEHGPFLPRRGFASLAHRHGGHTSRMRLE